MRTLITAFGFIVLGALLAACGRAPASPAPTPAVRFITATPGGPDFGGQPISTAGSPLPSTATPIPTLAPLPTSTPFQLPSNTPTPLVVTSTPATAYAIIDAPSGFVNVRQAPGIDAPSLGAYNNGAQVEIIGKQNSSAGELWWLIPFTGGANGQGWIYAAYTDATNVGGVPWVTAPVTVTATPTPTRTPQPPPIPHAIIDSPRGFVYVRSGPGEIYEPTLGRFSNGRFVDIIGKQLSSRDQLWWLIPFPASPNGGGWIYANDTIARFTDYVPWVVAPSTPTPSPTRQVTPSRVDWTITGRVIDNSTGSPIGGAFVGATLGAEGTTLSATADSNGQFIMAGRARDEGNLVLTVAAQGFVQRELSADPVSPRVYDFPTIELERQEAPVVTWAIFGRVTELGTSAPIPGARIEAILGLDGVRLEATSNDNGEFSMNGQARNRGNLSLNLTANGYQANAFTSAQTDSRIYNLPNLQLVPQAGSCRYESVIDLNQTSALARLQNLSFTNVTTQTVDVGGDQNLIDRVVVQQPGPPPEGQSIRLSCQIPITLGIGGVTGTP